MDINDFTLGERDDGVLFARTAKGDSIEIPPCDVNIKNFFRKGTVLYGPSQTGKTILTKYIMRQLSCCFPIVFIFCPTNSNNESFTDVVPNALIFERVTVDIIKKIYERAKYTSKLYQQVNNLTILKMLFMRTASLREKQNETFIITQRDKAIREAELISRSKADVKREHESIINHANETLRKMYKISIKHAERLGLYRGIGLTDRESQSLKFINYNPEILLIFDDCATELQKISRSLAKDTTLLDFFFKGRHAHLTTIYTFQDDSVLPAPMRKNAHNSIFCTRECAMGFFERKTNNIATFDRKRYMAAAEEVFQDYNQYDYKRLIFCREDSKYPIKYIKGDEEDFRMCASIVWKYCEKIKKKDDIMDDNSEWAKLFLT